MSSIQLTPRSSALGFALLLSTTALLSGCSEPLPPVAVDQQTVAEQEISSAGESRTGLYSYYADAALFTDCGSGERLPLHLNASSLELERAYSQAGLHSAQPMLVEIIGQVEVRPGMEDGTQLPHMVISQLIRVSDEQTCPQAESSLFNERWQLIEIAQDSTADSLSPYLQFDEKGTFHGHTGCNNVHGSYELDGNSLSLFQVAVTKMACPDQDQQEGVFLQALSKVTGLTQQDRQLRLTDENGATLLQFEAVSM